MGTKALRAMYEAATPQWSLTPEGRVALAEVKAELDELEAAEVALEGRTPPYTVRLKGDEVHVDLWYPILDGHPKYVVVNQVSVRASDGVRLSYDYTRDGFVVEQPTDRSMFVRAEPGPHGQVHFRDETTWTQVFYAESRACQMTKEEEKAHDAGQWAKVEEATAALKDKP